MPRTAVQLLLVCALSIAAAAVAFAQRNWLGVVWVALAGVSSNVALFHIRKAKREARSTADCPSGKTPAACTVRCGACGDGGEGGESKES